MCKEIELFKECFLARSDGRIESNNNNTTSTSGATVKKEIWIISDQKAVAAPGTSVGGDPRSGGAGNVTSMPSCIGPDGILGRGVKFMEAKMEKLGRPWFFACTYDYVLYGLGAHFMDLKIAQISNKDQDLAGYLDFLCLVNANTIATSSTL